MNVFMFFLCFVCVVQSRSWKSPNPVQTPAAKPMKAIQWSPLV